MDLNEQYKELEKATLDEIINPNTNITLKFLDGGKYTSASRIARLYEVVGIGRSSFQNIKPEDFTNNPNFEVIREKKD